MPMGLREGQSDDTELKTLEVPQRDLAELPDDSGENLPDAKDQQTVETKQEIADKTARDYNEKYNPSGSSSGVLLQI